MEVSDGVVWILDRAGTVSAGMWNRHRMQAYRKSIVWIGLVCVGLILPACTPRLAWSWQRFERCPNCGRVVGVKEIDGNKCRACGEGWRG
jgi:hypothetical protein